MILLITHSTCGGVERMTLLYAKILKQAGYDCCLLISQKPSDDFELKPFIPDDLPYELMRCRYRHLFYWIPLYLLRTKPCCVFYSFPLLMPSLILSKLVLPGMKVLFRDCNMPSKHRKYQSCPAKYILRYADALIAQTEEMKQEMAAFYHVHPERITVINNPIDKSIIQKSIKEKYRYDSTDCVHYIAVERICPQKVIRNEQPDFVLAIMHPTFLNSFAASIGTKSIVIATEHNAFERPNGVSMGGRNIFFKFFATRLFKAVTILTEADRRVIYNRLRNIHVMPNPLAFKPISLQELSIKRKKQIVAAGRMDVWHYKGFDILIQAWGNIAESHKRWTLNIAGEGSEASLNFLKGVVKDCHVEDSVIFSGFHTDLDMLFHESEIFVLSSRYEGFGMVLIEAMSQGCACIACDYKGRQREIIRSEEEGLCIELENIDQLAEAMSHMIKDETYKNSIRYHGLLRSKAYDASVIAKRWEELFREIQK